MRYVSAVSSALVVFGLGACGELPGFEVSAKTDNFIQNPELNDQIDILFVVDNSGSMAEEQKNLADSFEKFIEKFSSKNLDFHVGVISTDVTNNGDWWSASGYYRYSSPYRYFPNEGPGSLLARSGNDRFLNKESEDLIGQFVENVRLGIGGSGAEAGALSLIKALSEDKLNEGEWNHGFLRPSALLAVIVVSDEDEGIGYGGDSARYIKTDPELMDARLQELESMMLGLKKDDTNLLRFDAIVAPSQEECPTVYNSGGVSGVGDFYMAAAEIFNGTVSNVCEDFSASLEDLGSDLVRLLSRFKLIQKPTGQIEVRVNGTLIPRDPLNGWEYLAETQEVEFRGDAVPSADAKIEISYVPGEPLR